MSDRRKRILSKLCIAWEAAPDQHFGLLVENLENIAWDIVDQRNFSPRLMNMSDELFEAALDKANQL